jgi:hypothetical protein
VIYTHVSQFRAANSGFKQYGLEEYVIKKRISILLRQKIEAAEHQIPGLLKASFR